MAIDLTLQSTLRMKGVQKVEFKVTLEEGVTPEQAGDLVIEEALLLLAADHIPGYAKYLLQEAKKYSDARKN